MSSASGQTVFGSPALFPASFDQFHGKRFLGLLCFYGGPALWLLTYYPGYGTTVLLLGSIVQAYRGAWLTPATGEVADAIGRQATMLVMVMVALLVAQRAFSPLFAVLTALFFGYWLVIQLRGDALLHVLYDAPTDAKASITPRTVPPIPMEAVRAKRLALAQALTRLPNLAFFTADDPQLLTAWNARNVEAIESLLSAGDTLNRSSWREAGTGYNEAAAAVDQARARLAQILAASEATLARYQIDYRTLDVQRSGLLAGEAKLLVAAPKHWTQHLDYSQGAGNVVRFGRNLPWQAQAAMAATMLVMAHIAKSKKLRQLKELEGQIAAMASAMRGDVGQMQALIETRLLPQFDWAVRVMEQLDELGAHLRASELLRAGGDGDRALAMRLGFAIAEGNMLMAMKAGN